MSWEIVLLVAVVVVGLGVWLLRGMAFTARVSKEGLEVKSSGPHRKVEIEDVSALGNVDASVSKDANASLKRVSAGKDFKFKQE